jgi:hypothetical protein
MEVIDAGQHRSTQRDQRLPAEYELRLVARMNQLAAAHPRYGHRRVWAPMRSDGWRVKLDTVPERELAERPPLLQRGRAGGGWQLGREASRTKRSKSPWVVTAVPRGVHEHLLPECGLADRPAGGPVRVGCTNSIFLQRRRFSRHG